MDEIININPDINVQETEYKRLLGYPNNYILEGRSKELAGWAREWYKKNGKPWIYAKHISSLKISKENLDIVGFKFNSKRICKQFTEGEADSIIVVAVSAGLECEQMAHELWKNEKPDEYFFLEIFGSVVVEHLINITGYSFCKWAEENKLAVLPHYSPGYPGWNIKDQVELLSLIKLMKNDLPGMISVLETGMLYPKKSQLAVFGITKQIHKVRKLTELIPCESCPLQSCNYRRTSYRYSNNQIEDIRELQSRNISGTKDLEFQLNQKSLMKSEKSFTYSINPKTLKKWSDERLKLKVLEDNSIEAVFHYDGTTCSNFGHPLEFDFSIKLNFYSGELIIEDLKCIPAPGDDGYFFMCEYIKDQELINTIQNEKPLIGKSINEVLTWKREFSPEGCFCSFNSRMHKWDLVFEVIHFSLNQFNKNSIRINNLLLDVDK